MERPRSIRVAASVSLFSAVLGVLGAISFVVRADSLAADAHQRDDKVSVEAFRVIFEVFAGVTLVIAVISAIAVWALWQRRRPWAWWLLVVLSAFGALSLLQLHSVIGGIVALTQVVAVVALLMPSARAYVRHRYVRPAVEDPERPWAGEPPTFASGDDWLQGR